MKRKMMIALLLTGMCLATGCSQKAKETEAPAKAETEAAAAVKEEAEKAEKAASEAAENVMEEASEAAENVMEEASEAAENVMEEASEEVENVAEEASEALEEEMTEVVIYLDEAESEGMESLFFVDETEEETEEGLEDETEGEQAQVEELGPKPEYKALDYVKLGTYKGLPVEVTKTEVSDEEVQAEMDADIEMKVADQELEEKITEGTVSEGDVANIDFVGKMDGEPFDGGTGEDYDLKIGSGTFVPGFEEQLVGVKIGDTVDIDVTFPEEYYEELAGKAVVFTVTVNYLKKMPEVNDELISKISGGEYTSMDAYRTYEREKQEAEAKEMQENEANTELMTQLYNTCIVESMPEAVVDYNFKSARNYYIQMAGYYGISYENMISQYGMDVEQFESYFRQDIESSLKQEMILLAIGEQEGITVSDEEYQEGCENYAKQYGFESAQEFEAAYDKEEISRSLLMNKIMTFIRENAVITEVEPETDLAEDGILYEMETEAETAEGESIE